MPSETEPRPEASPAPETGPVSAPGAGDASGGGVLSPIDRLTELVYGMVAVLSRVPVPARARVSRDDLLGAVAIFFLANAALLPLAVPFVLLDDLDLAQHVSNAVALVLLFGVGHRLARYTGERPFRVALGFVAFGLVLVAATLALGG